MTPALFAILATLLVFSSATAGALWWRSRSLPWIDLARLTRDLIERQVALEALVKSLEAAKKPRPSRTVPTLRLDRGKPADSSGPTLIAVPDLAATPGRPAVASAEMARRFGPIWELADSGASAESIARATGQPVGQVELILGLRHPKGA